ncbi:MULTISPECIES: site-specific DNA-methyltransferase [unclassified Collinsella]|uniref:site-specific DNA-methyltransferase n=1 Tax=unclassified Collinsella TaxID=2637548 RepID=UPI003F9053AE
MAEIEKMNLESEDLVEDRLAQLKELMPEVFTESGIDFDKLRLELGDEVDEGRERYAFTWPGKMDAIRQSQTPSTATLRPCVEKSRGRDGEDGSFDSDNIYIEGDNLEVLKLLQSGYHGKVKMIYIDPPYNTGKDFVYKDKFGDTIENYKKQAGLANQSNADTSGRYHSDWCSMMYPRLRLARELLTEDGVIFISIDDNEDRNLRIICDEVFGETNFLAQVVWERAYSPINLMKHFSPSHDYVLCYAKNVEIAICNGIARSDEANNRYANPDNDPRGVWKASDLSVGPAVEENIYEIKTPSGRLVKPPAGRSWRLSRTAFRERLQDNRIWFGPKGDNVPAMKRFLSELRKTGVTPMTIWKYEEVDHSQAATQKLAKMFDGKKYFDYPKPVKLLERCLELYTTQDCIVVDFFSGSATTAHAAMNLNTKDGGNRKYIMVQLPEPNCSSRDAFKDGYATLCDIGEERIRRAGDKIKAEIEDANVQLKLGEESKKLPDIGFRVFSLDNSGIEKPQPGQLVLDVVKPDRSDMDIVFEMMLKWGLELTLPVEKEEVAGYPVYSVACGELVCCLADGLTMEALDAIADMEPRRVLMRDSILTDTLKLNAVQAFRRVEERAGYEVQLRTV